MTLLFQREQFELLKHDLLAADFRHDAVRMLLGEEADRARTQGVFAPARRALAQQQPSTLKTFVRLFLMRDSVDSVEVQTAFANLGASKAMDLGLIEAHTQNTYRSIVSLNIVRLDDSMGSTHEGGSQHDWWILSDLDDALRNGPVREDHVMGVGGATRSLIAQLPPTTSALSLDLGTGCGIVAMHLSLRGQVIATDLSARALSFARANAVLNERADAIEFREGSLFEPVTEKFTLIASNPPFVITPRFDDDVPVLEYRDGGMAGDSLMQTLVTDSPSHLEPGGQFICLANWESPWGSRGLARVGEWIEAAALTAGPIGAWVIERDQLSPAQYAQTWVRDGGLLPQTEEFERLMGAWLADFSQRRITALGLGTIRLVALSPDEHDSSIIRLEHAQEALTPHGLGAALQHAFEQGLQTARLSDDEVLGLHWICDDRVREMREHRPGVESPRDIRLHIDVPIERSVQADPLLAAAVGVCDGDLSLRQIAEALSTLLEVDLDACADALTQSVRELTWLGMLHAADK